MKTLDFVNQLSSKLIRCTQSPYLDAKILVEFAIGSAVHDPNHEISAKEKVLAENLCTKRIKGQSIAKIVGQKEFWKYKFEINNCVLDPRPESELFIEEAIEILPTSAPIRILDLGSGSGCIALSLLIEFKIGIATLLDISHASIQVAIRNAYKLGVSMRASFVLANYKTILPKKAIFDLIVCNPPYLSASELLESKNHINCDPRESLCTNLTGEEIYYSVAQFAYRALKNKGYLLIEIGPRTSLQYFVDIGFRLKKTKIDLAGIPRLMALQKI